MAEERITSRTSIETVTVNLDPPVPGGEILFPLAREQVVTWVGKQELEQAESFARKFGPLPLGQEPRMRMAPSIITRSTLLLFNLDLPRFAVRLYLSQIHGSFANLRRIEELSQRLKAIGWTLPDAEAPTLPEGFRVHPHPPELPELFAHLREQSRNPIADCVLVPTNEKFYYVTADLGRAYGEGHSIRAVSYVRPLRGFSGAACAQSCAFMTAVSLHDHAVFDDPASATQSEKKPEPPPETGVHGLVEISSMITPEQEHYLLLGETPVESLARYFQKTGRTTFLHTHARGVDAERASTSGWIHFRAGTYIRSGFTCILPTRGNYFDQNRPLTINHAMVLVGVEKAGTRFVVNDPATQPFAPAAPDALADWSESRHGNRMFASFMCVVPGEVHIPLTNATVFRRKSERELAGICEIAQTLQSSPTFLRNVFGADHGLPPPTNTATHDWQLVFFARNREGKIALPKDPGVSPPDPSLDDYFVQHQSFFAGRWCWLERRKDAGLDSLWLWNAELTPPRAYELDSDEDPAKVLSHCRRCLLGVFVKRIGQRWDHVLISVPEERAVPEAYSRRFEPYDAPITRPEQKAEKLAKTGAFLQSIKNLLSPPPRPLLEPCLISSFAPESLSLAVSRWPAQIHNCELYAFMHRDLDMLKKHWQGQPPYDPTVVSAAQVLAQLWNHNSSDTREGMIRNLAKEVIGQTKKNPSLKLRAISTFIPHLLARQPDRRTEALAALRTLFALARSLHRESSEFNTIEFVGGGRVIGLVPALAGGEPDHHPSPTLFARRLASDASVLEVAQLVLGVWNDVNSELPCNFTLSIELEPGPLFVMNKLEPLETYLTALESNKIGRVLGFNLDIAHFALAGIDPGMVLRNELLMNRITHFHISDHGLGHFGDVPLGHCSLRHRQADALAVFRPWIRLARHVARRPREAKYPRFSGLVSIELEAVRSAQLIDQTVQALLRLLRE